MEREGKKKMRNTFLEFIEEEKNNEKPGVYDTTIFYVDENGTVRLRDTVLKNLLAAIDRFDELIPIEGAYLSGPICSKKNEENTPVDVYVLMDKNDINRVIHDRLMEVSSETNRGLVADTRHPLHVNIVMVDGQNGAKRWVFKQQVCFDIAKNKFEKEQEEFTEDVRQIVLDIDKKAPTDLVFFKKKIPFSSVDFESYTKETLEKIKSAIKNKLFDLTREANGKATNTIEKNFVKELLNTAQLDAEKLEAKFVTNDVSEDVAMCLLKQRYYYGILDLISDAKSQRSIENDFSEEMNKLKSEQAVEESEQKHMTFYEFVLTEDKKHIKKLKTLKALKDTMTPGKAGKSRKHAKYETHANDAMKARSMQRQRLRMLAAYREMTKSPQEEISDEFSCQNLIHAAKDRPRGFWPLNIMQVKWICAVYHCDPPTQKDRIKRLSNMPMAIFRPKRGGYFLVKDQRLSGIS